MSYQERIAKPFLDPEIAGRHIRSARELARLRMKEAELALDDAACVLVVEGE